MLQPRDGQDSGTACNHRDARIKWIRMVRQRSRKLGGHVVGNLPCKRNMNTGASFGSRMRSHGQPATIQGKSEEGRERVCVSISIAIEFSPRSPLIWVNVRQVLPRRLSLPSHAGKRFRFGYSGRRIWRRCRIGQLIAMDLKRVIRHSFVTRWHVNRAFPGDTLRAIEKAIQKSHRAHIGQIQFAVEGALHIAALSHGMSAKERAIDVFS